MTTGRINQGARVLCLQTRAPFRVSGRPARRAGRERARRRPDPRLLGRRVASASETLQAALTAFALPRPSLPATAIVLLSLLAGRAETDRRGGFRPPPPDRPSFTEAPGAPLDPRLPDAPRPFFFSRRPTDRRGVGNAVRRRSDRLRA